MENKDQFAFPQQPTDNPQLQSLTKREYFAGLAMQGIMTKDYVKLHIDNPPQYTNVSLVAEMAVAIADQLLKELSIVK